MRSQDPRGRRLRRYRPMLEGLEARAVPSIILSTGAPQHRGHRPGTAAVRALARLASAQQPPPAAGNPAQPDTSNGLGKGPVGPFLNPKVIQQSVNLLYGPSSPTPMTPTPREVRRQTLTGRWIGEYTVGPPGFSDRASTIHAWSKNGGSNAFLKGKLDLVLFPPADPGATPTPGNPYANRVTGFVDLFTQNLLQSSGVLALDLNATPGPGSNPRELPTHLSWTLDTGASIGNFSVEALFPQGTGTLDIRWIPDAHPLAGTMGSGKMIATFQGLLNYSQIANPISKFYS